MYTNLYEKLPHNGDGLLHGFMYGLLYGFVTLAKALEASGRAAPGPVLAGGSAAGQPRLRLFAKYAFEQRFLSKFTRQAWDRQACRGGEDPLWQGPSLDASALPIHPRRRLGFRVRFRVHEIRDHPKMPFVSLWAAALTRALLLGVVADSFGTRDGAVSNRPVSLGLNSPSVLPWGRPVEPRIATRTFWGMWHVTSSLLNGRSTGTAPATSPLGRPSLPGPILGDRACVRG